MRQRKTEIEAIANILEREHEDVGALAQDIWKLVDDYRRDRSLWVVAVRFDGLNFLYGPYESEAVARKDVEKGSIKAVSKDERYMILKLHSPSKIFESYEPPTLFDIR